MSDTPPSELVIPEYLQDYNETSDAHYAQIKELAAGAFAKHVLTKEGDNLWHCGRPRGSSVYYFHVAFLPHAIVVTGDIGDMIVRPGWDRGLDWLRDALHNGTGEYFGYLLGKVPDRHLRSEFMPGDVIEACNDAVKAGQHPLDEMQEIINNWAENAVYGATLRDAWYEAASNGDLECEWYGDYSAPDSGMLWCAHALNWFVRAWNQEQKG